MFGTIKKWVLALIIIFMVSVLGVMGFNTYLNHKKTSIKEQNEKERLARKQKMEEDEELNRQIAELERDRLQGWTPPANSYSILSVENINHLGMIDHPAIACKNCNSCQSCQDDEECPKIQPKLIFTRKVKEYIRNVLDSIVKKVNGEELEPDNYNDNVSPFLKRYNAALYGAAGTGKTELVNELVHHLYEKFSNPKVKVLIKEIEKLEAELERLQKEQKVRGDNNPEEVTLKDKQLEAKIDHVTKKITEKQTELTEFQKNHWIPPVFKIDGVQLQTGGAVTSQPNPEDKLRMIIEKCKKQAFDNIYSLKPYIVFIEEADQGKNVMTAEKGKLLEEFKNFLSTSEDKAGLRAKAQDPNSIIIIATNNFEQIDPAVVRRGRLGEKLNFNWTPALLEEYGNRNDSEWEKINWPKNDAGWLFAGNVNYQDLYKMTSRFGYSKFSDQFTLKKETFKNNPHLVNKANQIIKSYQTLSKNEQWRKQKEKELGKFPTGKKITVNGKEEDEMVCNWVLHFLFTFHDYNDRQDLDSFNGAEQIRSYDFGDAFNTREAIWAIYDQIGQEVTVLNAAKNVNAEIAQDIRGIKDLMLEVNDVRNQFREIQNKVNEVNDSMDKMREGFNSNLKILQNNIDRISSASGSGSEMSVIKSRLLALENQINSGSGGGSGGSSSNAQSIKKRLDELLEELKGDLSSLNSTEVFNKFIKFYNSI